MARQLVATAWSRRSDVQTAVVDSPQMDRRRGGLAAIRRANYVAATLQRLVRLYKSWDAPEPDKGYADKAAEYRAMLSQGVDSEAVSAMGP